VRYGSNDPVPEEFSAALIDAIAQHLTLPSSLQLGVYGIAAFGEAKVGSREPHPFFPTFSSEFLVEFRKNGSLKKLSLTQQSLAPPVDEAIAAAIYAADSAKSFPAISGATKGSELKVFIDFDVSDLSLPPFISKAHPLFSATVPLYQSPRKASPTLPDIRPKYPEEFRGHMVEGSVTLKFVIDESGKVVPGAYRLTDVSQLEFGREVLAIVPRLRYEPARIGNCRVKQLAEQKFNFKSVY